MKQFFICLILAGSAFTLHSQDTVKVATNLTPEQMAEQDYNSGLAALKRNECASAVELFTKSLVSKPNFDKALANRAIAYTHLKKHDDAIRDINDAIKINPQNPETYFNKGIIFFEMNLKDSEHVALDNCLKLKADHSEA
ncbi:MAG: tetratricopeptide repeat protein, partial [Bacteroidetes bacterium]|nr:tetratricopeptide repeat protein [Bacteroidota bacterium]